jgi:hypothetical protein
MWRMLLAVAVALLGTTTLAQPQSSNGQGAARFLSASVYAEWFTHREPSGETLLDLLVLWRGEPGWWAKGTGKDSSSGGSGSRLTSTSHVGGQELRIVFDRSVKSAEIQAQTLRLDRANVVMVDDVAAATPKFTTATVDPTLPSSIDIHVAVQRSPDVQKFLRCDETLPDARMQSYVALVCNRMMGR